MNASIMKILFFPYQVPYTLMEKYFTITNVGITKFQLNAVQPCPWLKKIVQFNEISIRCYLECVNPSRVNPALASQVVFQNLKIPMFLSDSLLNVH
jgi:hypothetical protein